MLRRIHALPGLIAAVVVSILALTGAILAINPALEWAGSSIPRAGQVSVADLAQRVIERYPGVERMVRKPSGAIVVYYFDAEVPGAALVDPRTGEQIAPFMPSGITRWVTDLHRSFLMGDAGRAAAGTGALAMLVLTLSGATMLAARLGGWRQLFGRIRGTTSQRLHAQFGRIAVLALLLTAFTGGYMSLTTFGIIPDGMDAEPAFPSAVSGGAPMGVRELAALQATDLTDLRELDFPYSGDLTDVYTLTTAQGMGYVDQATGEMLSYLPNGFLRQVYEMIFMLHTGEGLWWLGLVLGLAALTVPLMTATGIVIWWKRRRAMPGIKANVRAAVADTVILVGSEGNSTWGFAKSLHDALTGAGHRVHTVPMNQFAGGYRSARRMLILAATYGDGAAPSSATQFLTRLEKVKVAAALPVAVLGFGDRQFPKFCQFAKDVEAALAARGWPQLCPLHTVDRQSAQAFSRWSAEIGALIGTDVTIAHTPATPRTLSLQLVERVEYGTDVQAPIAVLRFVLPPDASTGFWRRIRGNGLPRFEAGDLVGILPPDNPVPRFYSLATSKRDGVLEICVRRHPGGLCSGYLHALKPGDRINAFVRRNPEFRPTAGAAPVVLIGAGTGIGPLVGFIRRNGERRPMHLYFGARDPQSDFLYEAELRKWLADKRLTKLNTAFSRATDRAYVQDRIAADAEALRGLIAHGAQIMVCGGRQMAQALAKVLEEVVTPLGLDLVTLKAQGRYVEDVY
ncbi:MAG TPA: PepSY domain-containing protein [Alphaproteobacteria bacterium]|nr:PepSY domain-containing protein [Alphaproteobacteria bacterium]